MKGFFQRLKSRGGPAADSGKPHLTLAAFGKHPGWDDHMPGIGVATDALAYIKQTLYVGGIGRQVDSGAWEKLEPEKRLEGFDHVFLWLRPDHILLGQLWSSRDRKGRSKYPMVLCLDGQGVSTKFVLEKAGLELERLRGICQTATTAEQVTAECNTSQERLRAPGLPSESKPGLPASAEARRRFLDHPDLGPERVGLLRVLHELSIGSANTESASRHCHLRVPAASPAGAESLALWSAFVQSAVPLGTPVLLISRKTAPWLDVIIGEPASDDFFCLGAGLPALPLTTQIPYDLSPELKAGWAAVEARFLAEEPAPPVLEPRASATAPAAGEKKTAEIPPPLKNLYLPLTLVVCAVVFIAAGVLLLFKASRSAKPEAATVTAPAAGRETAALDKNYISVMADGRAALNRQDYVSAIAKADAALSLKTNDAAATKLKSDALAEQNYQKALAAAQLAFNQAAYASAMSQAEAALLIKPNDAVALKLKTDAKAQLDLAAIAADQEREKYESAMKSAQMAFNREDYATAIAQVKTAMSIRTNDAAAVKLKAAVQARSDAAALEIQRQHGYDAAMAEAREALDKKDYSRVIAKADQALNLRSNDAGATALKNDALAAQREIGSRAEQESRYQQTISSAQAAFDAKDDANAIAQAEAALAIRPGDPAATALRKQAADDQDFQVAKVCIDRGEFEKAKKLCAAHAGATAFDELAGKLRTIQADRANAELEIYLVRFGLLDPKKAKTPEARRETRWLGELPIQAKDQCLKAVDVLGKTFQAAGSLDAARKKQLDQLNDAINNHL